MNFEAQQGTVKVRLHELTSDCLLITFHLSLMCYASAVNSLRASPQQALMAWQRLYQHISWTHEQNVFTVLKYTVLGVYMCCITVKQYKYFCCITHQKHRPKLYPKKLNLHHLLELQKHLSKQIYVYFPLVLSYKTGVPKHFYKLEPFQPKLFAFNTPCV